MAEGVVALLIVKLSLALGRETSILGAKKLFHETTALSRLFHGIHEVKEELEGMQSFLRGALRFKDTDETTANFIKKIRTLAFEIEDVIDEFTYRLEDRSHGGLVSKIIQSIRYIMAWCNFASKLEDIKLKIEIANTIKDRYDIRGITRVAGNIDDCSTSSEFDAAGWVTVSKSYQVEDLLKQIIRGFISNDPQGDLYDHIDFSNMRITSLIEHIFNYLRGKRYVLILDDVWGVDVWFKIRAAFPSDSTGRFVITSRIHEVALLATGKCVIQLEPLGPQHSWELFCKEAFWKNEEKVCPPELVILAQKFLDRCSGLPIAIACLGRLLSFKEPSYDVWENLYNDVQSQLTNNVILDINIVLKVSLEELPYELKNCFLHCTVFPEDYLMSRKRLVRHCVTAGIYRETRNKTMENVANDYLNKLVNRSLLQVLEKSRNGEVQTCQMHDIIRILALEKSEEECFCRVYDDSMSFLAEGTRRLSIQTSNVNGLSRSCAPHVRHLYIFGSGLSFDSLTPFLKSLKFLSCLDLQGVNIKSLPHVVFNLYNLRFLGLRNTKIETIPRLIGRLRQLEVLDACNTKLTTLPSDIVQLQKLRYLNVETIPEEADRRVVLFCGIRVPTGIEHLSRLQVLELVQASSETLPQLGSLTQLRTFAISKVRNEHCADLGNAIMKMRHLVHLKIKGIDEKEILQLEALRLPHSLSNLSLGGQLSGKSLPQLILSHENSSNLTRLTLIFSKLSEDSFSCLLNLHSLYVLHLLKAYEGNGLYFHATSFPKLKRLLIWDAPCLNKVEIEQGAMPSLVKLVLRDLPKLKTLPHGIDHLRVLEELELQDTSEELIDSLGKRDQPLDAKLIRLSTISNGSVSMAPEGMSRKVL
uniref:NB-ARC domain-containing protein n=1 Tax=Oryza nivara TaxID=4536 RepID=A0A0E0I0B7_ORYNI